MARTVDTSSTFENWRQNYNSLAADVGDPLALTTADKSNIVNAINYIMDQYFYFQDFDYDGSDGATSNTVFSGADNAGNTLAYSAGKILVFKNGALLRSGTDYTANNGTSVTLASSASNGDVVRFSVFTGSYENVGSAGSSTAGQWTLAGGTIYNHNTGGIIINADSSITTSLGTADSIQMQGDTYHNGSVYLNAQGDLRFGDSDSSHYAAIQAPATISTNYTLTLPADDGTSGQTLQTDGSGVLTWASAGTAPDITIAANNSTNETVYPVFVDGATGTQGLESDTGLTYNPSSGTLTSTVFVGALTGNVTGNASGTAATVTGGTQSSITTAANLVTVGTIGTGVWQGTAINQTYLTGQSGTNTGDQSTVSGSSGSCTGLSATATALATGRTIGMTGDVVWTSASFNGSGNVTGSAVIQTDAVDIAMLSASGTASSTTFLRGDNSWVVPTDTTYSVGAGGLTQQNFTTTLKNKLDGIAASATANAGTVTGSGTDDYFARWTSSSALEGRTAAQTRSDIGAGTSSVAVGGGSGDAHRGDQGATAYTHSQAAHAPSDANNYSHPTSAGNKHVPTGGASGEFLKYSSSGTAVWATPSYISNTDTLYSAGSGIGKTNGGTAAGVFSVVVNTSGGSNLTQDTNGVSLTATPAFTTVTATGDITSNTSSDIALKENIINIPNPLEKIAKIGGYMFDWKDHGYEDVHGKGHDTGILAQEIEAILPEIVNTRESGMKAVNYMKLIPLLVESIKELKTELDELKSSNS